MREVRQLWSELSYACTTCCYKHLLYQNLWLDSLLKVGDLMKNETMNFSSTKFKRYKTSGQTASDFFSFYGVLAAINTLRRTVKDNVSREDSIVRITSSFSHSLGEWLKKENNTLQCSIDLTPSLIIGFGKTSPFEQ